MTSSQPSNFDFLGPHDSRLAQLGAQAERYFADDPQGTLTKLRLFAELLAQETAARLGVSPDPAGGQSELLGRLRRASGCPTRVLELFHFVREAGNEAVHGFGGTHGKALTALKATRELAVWFHRSFGGVPDFKAGLFRPPQPPPDPAAALTSEIERLRGERDAALSSAERDKARAEDEAAARRTAEDRAAAAERERAEWEMLTASIEADHAAIQAGFDALLAAATAAAPAERAAVVRAVQAAAIRIDLDEAATRDLIDIQLRARGWEADSASLRHSRGTRPERGRNLAIAEWPTETGPADYALFAGLLLVGIVEAKRANKDVPGKLSQAERYARGFALHGAAALGPGAPWTDQAYRAPFAFSANGRPYLKQMETLSGIWFRDLRRPTNLPRALHDWHEPSDLLAMLGQDTAAADAALAAAPLTFGFELRPYQERAVRAVEAGIAEGRRELLVAMATGTGKTKLSVALLFRLLTTNRFRRICFVVDRTVLGDNAWDDLTGVRVMGARTLAECFNVAGLDAAGVAPETRVHVTTIQGLVKRVLGPADPADVPPPGQYDLLVVDECHRGYLLDREMSAAELQFRDQEDYQSQYRRALEHFDAVKVGLTATPALHTVEIFGQPVFRYSYREAVIDGWLCDHEPPIRIETKLARQGIRYRKGESLTLLDLDTNKLDLTTAPDDLGFDLEAFNREVLTEPFNQAVCTELASHLDPEGQEKALVFCANDRHADLVVKLLRDAFAARYGEVEAAAVEKITGSVDNPRGRVRAFRNEANPRVAVTVDLLTTGVDIPRLTSLVFMRRVGSRILYDQMLGRATRLCDEIGKETFRIYDAVGLYDVLKDITAMKPVAADPKLRFRDLLSDLARATDPAHQVEIRDQLLAKLRARLPRLTPEAQQRWEAAAGEAPERTIARLAAKVADPDELRAWAAALDPAAGNALERAAGEGGRPPLVVSEHEDEVEAVRPVFGPGQLAPENYLAAFGRYVQENANRITALQLVTTRPRDLTRAALREVRLALDGAGYREADLHAAWRLARAEDVAAGVVAHVRRAALGEPLRPWAARVEEATSKLLARPEWTEVQRQWLRRIGGAVARMEVGAADASLLDEGAFAMQGGAKRADRVFGGGLAAVLGDLNEEIWRRAG